LDRWLVDCKIENIVITPLAIWLYKAPATVTLDM